MMEDRVFSESELMLGYDIDWRMVIICGGTSVLIIYQVVTSLTANGRWAELKGCLAGTLLLFFGILIFTPWGTGGLKSSPLK